MKNNKTNKKTATPILSEMTKYCLINSTISSKSIHNKRKKKRYIIYYLFLDGWKPNFNGPRPKSNPKLPVPT